MNSVRLQRYCVANGDFTLASGGNSRVKFDVVGLFHDHATRTEAVAALVNILDQVDVADVLVGVELGGALLAAMLPFHLEDQLWIARKSGEFEGIRPFYQPKTAVILEDVVTTGGPALKVVDGLQKRGIKTTAVVALVTRPHWGGHAELAKRGIPLVSSYTMNEFGFIS